MEEFNLNTAYAPMNITPSSFADWKMQNTAGVGNYAPMTQAPILDKGFSMDLNQGSNGGGLLNQIGGIGNLVQGLASLGQVYASLKGIGIAKDQLNFQKDAWNQQWDRAKKAFNQANYGRSVNMFNGNNDKVEQYKKAYNV